MHLVEISDLLEYLPAVDGGSGTGRKIRAWDVCIALTLLSYPPLVGPAQDAVHIASRRPSGLCGDTSESSCGLTEKICGATARWPSPVLRHIVLGSASGVVVQAESHKASVSRLDSNVHRAGKPGVLLQENTGNPTPCAFSHSCASVCWSRCPPPESQNSWLGLGSSAPAMHGSRNFSPVVIGNNHCYSRSHISSILYLQVSSVRPYTSSL